MAMPTDPVTLMGQAAAEIHELFLSFVKAGFTRKEALYLVGQHVAAATNQTPGTDG